MDRTPPPVPGTLPPGELFVAVQINGRLVDEFARLYFDGEHFYASRSQFVEWRLIVRETTVLRYAGDDYYPIEVSGIVCRLDREELALSITAPPGAFVEHVLNLRSPAAVKAVSPQPGLFLNHDFQLTKSRQGVGFSGLGEVGFFSKFGVFTIRLVGRQSMEKADLTRLDTQFVRDFPGRMATMSMGDAVSAAAPWARQVHYAGLRWASKFSTQPDFVPFLLPTVSGQVAAPSTVDLYVNNVRTSRHNVDTGPFAIRNIPVITGQGELRLVATDIMGRQQVISQPYLSNQQLLRKGINEYTYEAGAMRTNFGLRNSGYRSLFFAGTQRHGLSDSLTLDWRAELLGLSQTLGIGASYGVLPFGLIGNSLAVSHDRSGFGVLVNAQLQHRSRAFSYSAKLQAATRNFSQLGLMRGERVAKVVAQSGVTRTVGYRGSVSLGFLRQIGSGTSGIEQKHQSDLTYSSVTASVSARVTRTASFAISVNYSPRLRQGTSVAMSLVLPLSGRQSVVATGDLQPEQRSGTLDFSRQLPIGSGYGYRIRNSFGDAGTTDAGLWLQNDSGTYSAEASRNNGQTNWRFTERGSVIWMGRHLANARWLDDSFGLVEVPAGKGVRVFANNQPIATTSGRGLAVIPRLVPYERNTVRLDDTGVPIEMGMDFSEKTVVPMPRTGVLLKFAAAKIEGAVLALVSEDNAVPLGAEVTINENREVFRVAMEGEVFIPKLSFPALISVRWPGGQCQARIERPSSNQPLPRIGPVPCTPNGDGELIRPPR